MEESKEGTSGNSAGHYNLQAELQQQYGLLLDKSQSLEDRLEAYDFITDSEIGDTPLLRARNAEREMGFRQIYLKLEGGNPTGTQKDRIAFAQCADALRRGFEGISLATCGNYGVACALAAKYAGLESHIFIPAAYHTRRAVEMEKLGAKIITVDGDYENAVEASQEYAATTELYDANPGGDNTSLQLKAYGEIAYEIYDELRDAPKVVAIPVSNGTVVAGVYKGFLSLYRRGKTSRMPLIVAGSSARKNPIVHSFLLGKTSCEDLEPGSIRETEINEPLINWHSFDGGLALNALYSSGGWASDVTDRSMLRLAKMLKEKEGLNVLPAATAGLAALATPPDPDTLQNDRFVAILTSRK
ncbi:MAG: pyridoxal-phosphate dependent enzyme [Phaeodactylibacter sp.]|nr:pyridoxal-phosphate dependent enzyme [Phaeodactylibacter sp.]MCB9273508.1 pyridoxal-phosphate dependent enzyme [Lewinellaceae bacterium]